MGNVEDPDGNLAASDVLARLGILQVRHPARGRKLPSHLPAGVRVRAADLGSGAGRELASWILARLHEVAGWVTRYHTFSPATAMGIAAPQLGIAYRIAIVRKPHSQEFAELVNPRVTAASAQLADGYEGCLSFFDVRGIARRPISVTVTYDRPGGEPVTTVYTGALARGVQHEIDHLNGKLYTDEDRMPAGMSPIPYQEYRAVGDRHTVD